jgi:type II secretory pathway pseudopilin PulG
MIPMNSYSRFVTRCSDRSLQDHTKAFSLVEVVIAIGIFSFVIVGIFGLLPAALKQRENAAEETYAVLIAEELFAGVRAAEGAKGIVMRDGPGLGQGNNVEPAADLTRGPLLLGYPSQTTVPFGLWHSSRGNDPEVVWKTGELPQWAIENGIATLAKMSAEQVAGMPNLYQVKVEVRLPASLPLEASQPVTFTTLVHTPL